MGDLPNDTLGVAICIAIAFTLNSYYKLDIGAYLVAPLLSALLSPLRYLQVVAPGVGSQKIAVVNTLRSCSYRTTASAATKCGEGST
jgi:hypothetical protein